MKNYFITLLFIFSLFRIEGQLDVSFYQEDYTPLSNNQLLTYEVWDDPDLYIPLGFDFVLFGDTINGLTTYGGYHNELFTESLIDSNIHVVVPFLADLIDPGFFTEQSEGNISYEISGEEPYRVCKIQWENCAFYNEYDYLGTLDDRVNFQVWLLETSNTIEYHYGEMNIIHPEISLDNSNTIYIGIIEEFSFSNENFINEYHLINSTDNPFLESTFSNFIDLYLANELSLVPTDGQVFRFEIYAMVTEVNNLIENEIVFSAYPSLFEESIHLNSDKDFEYSIYNIAGQVVSKATLLEGNHTIALEFLKSGIYFIQVFTETGEKSIKLVKK